MTRLVLVGAGHAHAEVIRELALRRSERLQVVVVSPHSAAPYSGMMPGWLAGHYDWDECCIDIAHLCTRAGATLVLDTVTGIDTGRTQVMVGSGKRLDFDYLSLDIGATLRPPDAAGMLTLPMRPLDHLKHRWEHLLDTVSRLPDGATYHLLMVGGGAAGVESVLAAQHRLTRLAPSRHLRFSLATHGDTLIPGQSRIAARLLRKQLEQRGIAIHFDFSADRIDDGQVVGHSGEAIGSDAVLWATGAEAHAWPQDSGLALDARGFVRVDRTLRSQSHPAIFAAGDCAGWELHLPKAGVYAVRMGPVLARNLFAVAAGKSLETFRPQHRHLVLIGTGDAHAVASWSALGWQGKWVWRWKQRIDRRFIARYNGPAQS